MQIVLEFPEVFWDNDVSFFGAALPGGDAQRGRAFMFWNIYPVTGRKQLIALLSGEAAYQGEDEPEDQLKVKIPLYYQYWDILMMLEKLLQNCGTSFMSGCGSLRNNKA